MAEKRKQPDDDDLAEFLEYKKFKQMQKLEQDKGSTSSIPAKRQKLETRPVFEQAAWQMFSSATQGLSNLFGLKSPSLKKGQELAVTSRDSPSASPAAAAAAVAATPRAKVTETAKPQIDSGGKGVSAPQASPLTPSKQPSAPNQNSKSIFGSSSSSSSSSCPRTTRDHMERLLDAVMDGGEGLGDLKPLAIMHPSVFKELSDAKCQDLLQQHDDLDQKTNRMKMMNEAVNAVTNPIANMARRNDEEEQKEDVVDVEDEYPLSPHHPAPKKPAVDPAVVAKETPPPAPKKPAARKNPAATEKQKSHPAPAQKPADEDKLACKEVQDAVDLASRLVKDDRKALGGVLCQTPGMKIDPGSLVGDAQEVYVELHTLLKGDPDLLQRCGLDILRKGRARDEELNKSLSPPAPQPAVVQKEVVTAVASPIVPTPSSSSSSSSSSSTGATVQALDQSPSASTDAREEWMNKKILSRSDCWKPKVGDHNCLDVRNMMVKAIQNHPEKQWIIGMIPRFGKTWITFKDLGSPTARELQHAIGILGIKKDDPNLKPKKGHEVRECNERVCRLLRIALDDDDVSSSVSHAFFKLWGESISRPCPVEYACKRVKTVFGFEVDVNGCRVHGAPAVQGVEGNDDTEDDDEEGEGEQVDDEMKED